MIFSILINTSNHVMFTGKAWGLLSVAVRLCNDVNEGARINSHSYWFISVFDYDDSGQKAWRSAPLQAVYFGSLRAGGALPPQWPGSSA
uniref:hypothetical protein n=1 Tax=Hafnia alvei TaxID=569 RepID=UPI003F5820CA